MLTIDQTEAANEGPDFNVDRYVGQWYEIYRTKNIKFEKGTDINESYSLQGDGKIKVVNREWHPDAKKWHTLEGVAYRADNIQPAHLKVKFFWWLPAGDYNVFRTDYENYSLVVSEVNTLFGLIRMKMAWVLARTPQLPDDVVDEIFEMFENVIDIKRNQFIKTNHGCAPNN